jgi:hypothetical protein
MLDEAKIVTQDDQHIEGIGVVRREGIERA